MSSQNRKTKREPVGHVIETRNQKYTSQTQTQPSQVSKVSDVSTQPSTSLISTTQLRTKKQRAKERGRQLQEVLKEKRALGLIKKSNKPHRTKSEKAGIYMPVARFLKKLKKSNPKFRIATLAVVFFTAVVEYLTAEVLELSGNVSIENKRKRIIPRHIFLAIKNDQELELLLKDTVLVQAGTVPGIHPSLIKTKTSKIVRSQPMKTEQNNDQNQNEVEVESKDENDEIPQNQEEPRHESTSSKRKSVSVDDEGEDEVFEESNQSNRTSTPAKRNKH